MLSLEEFVTRKLQETPKIPTPFPHFFCENVFPADFYAELRAVLDKKTDFHTESYLNRSFADQIGINELDFMLTSQFLKNMLLLFRDEAVEKFGDQSVSFTRDLRLVRDQQHYKIGPHTDAPWKVLSLLFYLPPTDEYHGFGTSLYIPDDPEFRCEGGRHHKFEGFTEVWRAPYIPNSCLGFWKTDKSFHGVPTIPVQFQRDVLLYNIYRAKEQDG